MSGSNFGPTNQQLWLRSWLFDDPKNWNRWPAMFSPSSRTRLMPSSSGSRLPPPAESLERSSSRTLTHRKLSVSYCLSTRFFTITSGGYSSSLVGVMTARFIRAQWPGMGLFWNPEAEGLFWPRNALKAFSGSQNESCSRAFFNCSSAAHATLVGLFSKSSLNVEDIFPRITGCREITICDAYFTSNGKLGGISVTGNLPKLSFTRQ